MQSKIILLSSPPVDKQLTLNSGERAELRYCFENSVEEKVNITMFNLTVLADVCIEAADGKTRWKCIKCGKEISRIRVFGTDKNSYGTYFRVDNGLCENCADILGPVAAAVYCKI